jgi:predicted cupin superfamily sugar epimerase
VPGSSIPAGELDFSFVGCTVSPGFEFIDFELEYPQPINGILSFACRID